MNRRRMMIMLSSGGLSLPYSVDFSALPDGALPSPWNGSTWAIVSGVAVNTPTLEGELLTDPGLEGTYTSGQCAALSAKVGSPTLAESADAYEGSKAQEFTGVAVNNRLGWAAYTGEVGQWYQFSEWAKRLVDNSKAVNIMFSQTGVYPASNAMAIIDASYAQYKFASLSTTTNSISRSAAYTNSSTVYDTVVIDLGSFQKITASTIYSLLNTNKSNVIVKVQPSAVVDGTPYGIVLRANRQTSPDKYMLVTSRRNATTANVYQISVLGANGNTYTVLLAEVNKTMVSDAWLEVRATGDTVSVWYNDLQVGTDITIVDADLLAGNYHGMYSTGGNSLKGFFVQAA